MFQGGRIQLPSRAWRNVAIAVLALTIGSTGVAFGLVVNGVVEACSNDATGILRLATPAHPCLTSTTNRLLHETAISWNQLGQQGIQGVKGDPGAKGDIGPQGQPGAKGDTGSQGQPGAKGDAGAQGQSGAKGDPGAQGPKGDTGPMGVGAIASLNSLTGLLCNDPTGAAGTTRVVVADGNVAIHCDIPRPIGDTVAPVFSSVAVSGSLVTVMFSQPVCHAFPTAPSTDWTVISNGTVVPAPVVADSIPVCNVASSNGVSAALLQVAIALQNGALVGVTLNSFNGVRGSLSNSVGLLIRAPQTRTATVTAPETSRPTLKSATSTLGSTTLTFTFSEPVRCAPFLFPDAFAIDDHDPATANPMVTGLGGADPCGFTSVTADLSFSVNTDRPFESGRNYVVTLTPQPNSIEDVFGNDLDQPAMVPIDVN